MAGAGELRAPRAAFCRAFLAFAQRAFCPATILARASGLTVRFFALITAEVAVVAFSGADTAEEVRAALFFKAFFDFAQRARCAAAILSRASALNVRFFPELPAILLRPDCRTLAALVPISNVFTCCSRDISASISATIFFVSINPGIEDNLQLELHLLGRNFHCFDVICTALNFLRRLAFMRERSSIDFNGRAIFQKKGAD